MCMCKAEVVFIIYKYRDKGRFVNGRSEFSSYHEAVEAMSHLVADHCYDIEIKRVLEVAPGIVELRRC